jgi:hypothetical protein
MRLARHIVFVVVLGALALAAGRPARADVQGYGEVVAGFLVPAGDGDYRDAIAPSLKIGMRAGYLPNLGPRRLRWGFELAFDYSRLRDDVVDTSEGAFSFFRIRGMFGTRAIYQYKPGWHVFGRALVGVDMFSTEVDGIALGTRYTDSDVDVGLALELSGGLLVNMGKVALGAQLGIPVGVQFDDGVNDVTAYDAAFVSVDIDLLFTLAFPL